jgi:conjugative transfer signal peptidase TraF
MTRPDPLRHLALTACATTLIFLSALPHGPLIVWNSTASAPRGLYSVTYDRQLRWGDLVLAWLPREAEWFAIQRGYLVPGVPVVKHIAALQGDRVCADGSHVAINGRSVAMKLMADTMGRPLKSWSGCQTLSVDQVLLLNGSVSHSFDGRYFGPVSKATVIGKLRPLWTF